MVLVIFAFSFLFRVAIVFHNSNPPSSDIGLHGSIINLILDQGKLPTWNPYHMGGETLATPPGFHFFVTIVILLTGLSVVTAQVITAAFYSSIIVFPAYLVSRRIWKKSSAGLLAAFFAAVSALSLEMISWGGYTNIVSLSLIITLFYLFFKDIRYQRYRHLFMGALLFAALTITHTFSLFIVAPILGFYLFLMVVGKLRKVENLKIGGMLRFFVVSIIAGIVAVLPWILRVFNFYISASEEGAATGGLDNKNIILANRTVGIVILGLLIVVIPAVYMLRTSRKKMIDNQSLFLLAWFVVPIVLTQAYLFGIVTDYSRFMYFIDFPGIIIISAGLFYLFRYTRIAITKAPKRLVKLKKTLPITVLIASMFIFIIISPWSIFPDDAMARANYYSTIHEPEATTLDWIRTNTPKESILVADHLYGWWLGGIGERTTLSAADLEFLIYAHELEVAKDAQLLLKADYYFDNGIIQVTDNAGYNVTGTDIEFSIEKENGYDFPVFRIQEEGVYFYYMTYDHGQIIPGGNRTLAEMNTIGQPTVTETEDYVQVKVRYEDDLFKVNRTMTLKRGERFAELSYDVEVKSSKTNLFNIWFPMYTGEGGSMTIDYDNLSWYGFYYWNKMFGEVIFQRDLPSEINHIEDEPKKVEMLFRYPNQSIINIKMLVGVYNAKDLTWPEKVIEKYGEFLESPYQIETTEPIYMWNYLDVLKKYDVSYIISRNRGAYSKFAEDPHFRLILNNDIVAVFQVVR